MRVEGSVAGSRYQEVEEYKDGDLIVREGDASRVMFIIQRGEAVVTKQVGDGEVELATLTRGSFFGEMSLLESLPRSATVRARGDTRVLVISPGGLLLKIRRDPTFALEMLQQMSHRVRRLNESVAEFLDESGARDEEGDDSAVLARISDLALADARATRDGER